MILTKVKNLTRSTCSWMKKNKYLTNFTKNSHLKSLNKALYPSFKKKWWSQENLPEKKLTEEFTLTS